MRTDRFQPVIVRWRRTIHKVSIGLGRSRCQRWPLASTHDIELRGLRLARIAGTPAMGCGSGPHPTSAAPVATWIARGALSAAAATESAMTRTSPA